MAPTPGARFRQAVRDHRPLQVVGTINALTALMARQAGHNAIYLSGAGVANASCGLPDLGITTLQDVLTDVQRITDACDTPLLVDIDTGFGGAFSIARTIRAMERAGAAAVHIEDQVLQKRCGHRPNKAIVPQAEMVDRIKAAVDARQDDEFVIMARTDALAVEGMDAAIARARACVDAGADMVFPEALHSLAQYRQFAAAVPVPVLANITEFGATPLFTCAELADAGIGLVLYPLTAFRAMNQAALTVYRHLLAEGGQQALIDRLQTREELYQLLNYHEYERKLDELFKP